MTNFWETNIILESIAGSKLFGTAIESSDTDYMAVAVEPVEYVLGLRRFNSTEDHKLKDATVDRTVYGLRFFLERLSKGNPTMLGILYAPANLLEKDSIYAHNLRAIRDEFTNQTTLNAFLGYLDAQSSRFSKSLNGEVAPGRSELVEKYGMDTKFMGHAIRLGMQGAELAMSGTITLPMPEHQAKFILDIRDGKLNPEEFFEMINEFKDIIREEKEKLKKLPNFEVLENFLIDTYREYWGWM